MFIESRSTRVTLYAPNNVNKNNSTDSKNVLIIYLILFYFVICFGETVSNLTSHVISKR